MCRSTSDAAILCFGLRNSRIDQPICYTQRITMQLQTRPHSHAVSQRNARGTVARGSQARLSIRASAGNTSIHKLIERDGCVLIPGCYDALSAKVLEASGHKAAFVSGYAVSATLLGEPDLGLLTPPEMARKSLQICGAVSIPVISDADTGGGNVLNVQRTIRQLISSGVKGAFIEDQQWPKRAGHMRNKEVIAMDEFASKIAAAREAIGDADFFLVARTDARGTSAKYGLEDAITRANLYMDAGADASFVVAPRSDEELVQIGKQTKGLRACNVLEGGVTPLHTAEELKAMGFHLVVYPLAGLYAATYALKNVYDNLKEKGTTRDMLPHLTQFSDFNQLIGLEEAIETEERLTRREAGEKLSVRVRAGTKPSSS